MTRKRREKKLLSLSVSDTDRHQLGELRLELSLLTAFIAQTRRWLVVEAIADEDSRVTQAALRAVRAQQETLQRRLKRLEKRIGREAARTAYLARRAEQGLR